LPRGLTDTPLARPNCAYAPVVNHYKGIGLTSFAPGATETCGHLAG
jgi:hypothetical protein